MDFKVKYTEDDIEIEFNKEATALHSIANMITYQLLNKPGTDFFNETVGHDVGQYIENNIDSTMVSELSFIVSKLDDQFKNTTIGDKTVTSIKLDKIYRENDTIYLRLMVSTNANNEIVTVPV